MQFVQFGARNFARHFDWNGGLYFSMLPALVGSKFLVFLFLVFFSNTCFFFSNTCSNFENHMRTMEFETKAGPRAAPGRPGS
eukprot:COSAG05_NODE_1104_length_5872_cov_4.990473_6_plen_82_part_00